jgi:hypothetical protein
MASAGALASGAADSVSKVPSTAYRSLSIYSIA